MGSGHFVTGLSEQSCNGVNFINEVNGYKVMGGIGSYIRAASSILNNPSFPMLCERLVRPREAQVIKFDVLLSSMVGLRSR